MCNGLRAFYVAPYHDRTLRHAAHMHEGVHREAENEAGYECCVGMVVYEAEDCKGDRYHVGVVS